MLHMAAGGCLADGPVVASSTCALSSPAAAASTSTGLAQSAATEETEEASGPPDTAANTTRSPADPKQHQHPHQRQVSPGRLTRPPLGSFACPTSTSAASLSASCQDSAGHNRDNNRRHHQHSTFNAKFRAHSRHKSIGGRLDELALGGRAAPVAPVKLMLIEPPQAPPLPPLADTRSLVAVASASESASASSLSAASASSPASSQSSQGGQEASERGAVVAAGFERANATKEDREKQQEREDNSRSKRQETMSQTMQSIQSLSMQLNRAASMQGQLDEICQLGIVGATDVGNNHHQGHHHQGGEPAAASLAAGARLSRLVSKKASRVKELVLQNLGKAERTKDELFQMYEENFYKQQAHALKLQKEFKSYVATLSGAQEASKSLAGCIQQSTGHYQSARHDLVCESLSQLEHLNEDLMDKLRGQVLISLGEYLSQFNELRDKIAKRRRKLIDYDSSRRIYELTLASVNRKRQQQQQEGGQRGGGIRAAFMAASGQQQSAHPLGGGPEDPIHSATSQLMDEARLLKLREQFNYCKVMYDTINAELHEELPMVYEKKMKSLLMTVQNYFSLEAQFHSNAGKLFATASDVIDELPMSLRQQQQQQQQHQQKQQQQQQHRQDDDDNEEDQDEDERYAREPLETHKDEATTKALGPPASGSSGVGSSRGDSSFAGSSSSSASSSGSIDGDKSPLGDPVGELANLDGRPDNSENQQQQHHHHLGLPPPPPPMLPHPPMGLPSGDEEEEEEVVEVLDVPKMEAPEGVEVEVEVCGPLGEAGSLRPLAESVVVGALSQAIDEATAVPVPDLGGQEDERPAEETEPQQEPTEAATAEAQEVKIRVDEVKEEEEKGKLLYKVKTSYKYLAEDVDELCFEADEIIQVVQFDEAQEQEEGWLMGVREVNGQRGLFPANFTHPI